LVNHPAKQEGIGLGKALGRVTMQVFVRDDCPMIAAPVQCDVDGIPKGSHYGTVSPGPETSKVIPLFGPEATQIPRAITSLSTLENRDLDLIQPRRMHPREVEMQVRMRRQKSRTTRLFSSGCFEES